MNKEKLKKIKVLYYPYKTLKQGGMDILNEVHYRFSLHYIEKNKNRVRKKIENSEALNVVFVVQYIPGWNKLEPVYTKMKQDAHFHPVIVCVPLNIQNHKLMDCKGNDTYQYFIEHGYDAIDALQEDGSWFDLRRLQPDYLFHSRPYNHFMPKCYTSGQIAKYALICNVLYGASLTKNGEDVTLNKNYYRDVAIYFSFDANEQLFYENRFMLGCKRGVQNCFPYGAVGLEQILCCKIDKTDDTCFEKTVLWTPRWSTDPYIGGSNFFEYNNLIFSLARKNPNILFVLRPHPLMFGNFIKTGEMTEQDVKQFKDYCQNENNIILDESKEYFNQFWNSDLLITDASGIVPEYFVTGRPILYCHSSANFIYNEYTLDIINTCYQVRSKEDLLHNFYRIIAGYDEKQNDRKALIRERYGDVQSNSRNILKVLKRENR